ncbi:MAG: type II toxin-antitoxin system VapC family toxin [Coleofasciculaceae cyanobacterium SM2_1_6]|nr:type II toxin-antitoxin system VapC family toxin [Coleofasciculaceae cyanobacterium SM2_1_6]
MWNTRRSEFQLYSSQAVIKEIAQGDTKKLAEISIDFGYELPILCTPYELLGDNYV